MTESDIPVRRGRRDPQIAQALAVQEPIDQDQVMLQEYGVPGSGKVTYKVSKSAFDPNTQEQVWHGFEFEDNVQDDETPVDAARRIYTFAHGVIEEAIEQQDAINEEKYEERRRRPIVPRR